LEVSFFWRQGSLLNPLSILASRWKY
jgi:hypothetical protein